MKRNAFQEEADARIHQQSVSVYKQKVNNNRSVDINQL
jgi:hypothetical protein